MQNTTPSQSFPLFSIALISSTALSYEVLLTRLFSIIQYHHFAYMIISLALLGYGVSGTLLSLTRNYVSQHYTPFYISNIILFAISSLSCFLIAQHIGFNAEQMLWDYTQAVRLFGTYMLLMLPFLFAANAIGASLMLFGDRVGKLYAADLLGAGIGSVVVIALLFLFYPEHILLILAGLGFFTVAIASWEFKFHVTKTVVTCLICAVTLVTLPSNWLSLEISPYKGLPQLLRVPDTKIIHTKSGPLGVIQVVESPGLPLRYAPGLSLNATTEPPPQLAVFIDGDGMSAINNEVKDRARLSFVDQMTSAAVYHLMQPDNVLVLGTGTGSDILQARFLHSPTIDAVELNPQLVELMTKVFANYSGNLFNKPGTRIHIQDARGFISSTQDKFDVIQISLLDSHGASTSGLYALSENYLYTVEAIKQYLARLQPNGYLSITRWIKLPPRDTLKLLATVVTSMRESGIEQPGKQLALIRSWQTSTLLVKNGDISSEEITNLRAFCNDRSFDMASYPGIKASETNRFNILSQPFFYQGARELLGKDPQAFLQQYKFNLTPATDNQPYFANFFKWQLFPEIMSLKDSGGMPLMEWGYIILIATLVQAVIASIALIIIPLLAGNTRGIDKNSPVFVNFLYFAALGLGFLFIEIAFMQKFTLFLHHPLYSIAVVLAAFLLFAGLGSNTSKHWQSKWGYNKTIRITVIGISTLGFIYLLLLDNVISLGIGLPTLLKIIITVIFIAPLAFCMGIPFPLALGFLSKHHPSLIPWAWGVNGCASVISAVLAMLLAIHLGFNAVIICAMLLYAGAWRSFSLITRSTL